MNWEVGRVYKTRDGSLVRVISQDRFRTLEMKTFNYTAEFCFHPETGIVAGMPHLDLMELVREQHEADALASSKSGAPTRALNVRHGTSVDGKKCG